MRLDWRFGFEAGISRLLTSKCDRWIDSEDKKSKKSMCTFSFNTFVDLLISSFIRDSWIRLFIKPSIDVYLDFNSSSTEFKREPSSFFSCWSFETSSWRLWFSRDKEAALSASCVRLCQWNKRRMETSMDSSFWRRATMSWSFVSANWEFASCNWL